MKTKQKLGLLFLCGVQALKKRYQNSTGRFLDKDGRWTLTNQDVIWSLAWLFTENFPGNYLYHSQEILHLIKKAGQAILSCQDSQGKTPFIKADGSFWGKIYMPWTMFHWLESFRVCQDFLTAKERKSWAHGLFLAHQGMLEEIKQASVHNIFAWKAMSVYRAGEIFCQPSWKKVASSFLKKVASAIHPDGFWPEGSGPTVSYNTIYVHALGLYYFMSGETKILPALNLATEFHCRFLYPDGSLVETVDGRVKYKADILTTGWPGFLASEKGESLVSFLVRCLLRRYPEGFISPHLTSALPILPEQEFSKSAVFQERKQYQEVFRKKVCLRKRGPFFTCLSGYVLPERVQRENFENRWLLDRSCFVSVWHKKCGLIITADNSKNQPGWANFCFWNRACRIWSPVAARVSSTEAVDTLCLDFDGAKANIRLSIPGENRTRLTFSVRSFANCCARIAVNLRLPENTQIRIGERNFTAEPLTELRAELKPQELFLTENWYLKSTVASWFFWPVYPFNPYDITGLAPDEQVRAQLVFYLNREIRENTIMLFV